MPAPALSLSLFNHHTDVHYEALLRDEVLERARKLVRVAREKGLRALNPSDDPLVPIGMEVEDGRVIKNSLGVLDLSWQAARHAEWPEMIRREIEEIRANIRAAHGVEVRNLIWAGMGGSAEDKAMYQALGLLDGGVQVYILDSTDPAKLEAILADLAKGAPSPQPWAGVRRGRPPQAARSGRVPPSARPDRAALEPRMERPGPSEPLARALRETLVVGMAMGTTSYEPVLNLEKLDLLYHKHKVPSQANFLYMTLPGSLLDRFAGPREYRRVELQLDNDNTTAGRHSGPLTRGSLYPLALNGVDLKAWIAAAVLTEEEIHEALRLAAFLHGNGLESRDKVTLLLPREWSGAGVWSKQDFEESLGKSEDLGIKIFPAAGLGSAALLPVQHDGQDRVFWVVNVAGCDNSDGPSLRQLRAAGYPLAVLQLQRAVPLARYMQWVHYVVFALGWLRRMNFVTQPSVELYKTIANRLHGQARKAGKIERIKPWRALMHTPHRAAAEGGIRLYYDSLVATGLLAPKELPPRRDGAAAVFAAAFRKLRQQKKIEYAELTFYGDLRYRAAGRRLRGVLDTAAEAFANRASLSTDVYEGPAMNHSYHEMIIGHGRCFSTVLLAEKQTTLADIGYRPEYHRAQWLATKLALERRGRPVVGLTFPDLSPESQRALRSFFQQVAKQL